MVSRAAPRSVTVLVVEDDSDVRESIRLVLENDGFHTIAASDGAHGLALLAQHQPDVVLLDMNIPVTDGAAFLRLKARMSALADIPVIAITGHSSDVTPLGVTCVLSKPFALEEFLSALRDATRPRAAAVAL